MNRRTLNVRTYIIHIRTYVYSYEVLNLPSNMDSAVCAFLEATFELCISSSSGTWRWFYITCTNIGLSLPSLCMYTLSIIVQNLLQVMLVSILTVIHFGTSNVNQCHHCMLGRSSKPDYNMQELNNNANNIIV